MISRLGLLISRIFARIIPDPFVIAVLLTLFTAAVALLVGHFPSIARASGESVSLSQRAAALLDAWRADAGLWKFLAFSMQMCLVLVTGHALASAPPVRRLLDRLAGMPRSTAQAAALVGFAACLTAIFNWGFGLIVGAILARDAGRSLVRRNIPCHYPLLVGAGYTGLMTWHGGLSGSSPLSMTSLENAAKVLPKGTLDALAAAGYSGVPLTATLFSPLNLFVTLGLLALVPISLAFLSPRNPADMQDPPPWQLTSQPQFGEAQLPDPLHPPGVARRRTFADFLDSSPLASLLLVVLLVLALIRFSRSRSFFDTGLNEVNMAMLALGLVLHGSPRRYLAAVEDGARGCAGIILQFPLYAGIAAMMVVSGLASQIARGIAETGGPGLLPLLTFFAAAVINVFIPSGGGQWGVQGPIALESGLAAGIDPGVMTMAVAYGDQLTNMLQPFWALPLLAITGARARDIVGYTAIVMIAGGVWISLGMLVF